MSAIVQYPNAPVISAVAQYAYRMCRNVKHKVCLATGDDRYKAMNLARFKEITPNVTRESRELVAKLFNFPVELQLEVEDIFNNKNDFHPWTNENFYEICNPDSKIYFDRYFSYYRDRADFYPGDLWPRLYPIEHTVATNIKFDGKQRNYCAQKESKQEHTSTEEKASKQTSSSPRRLRTTNAKI